MNRYRIYIDLPISLCIEVIDAKDSEDAEEKAEEYFKAHEEDVRAAVNKQLDALKTDDDWFYGSHFFSADVAARGE